MKEEYSKSTNSIAEYLSVLLKWKKLLIINLLIIAILTTGISFLIPEQFKSNTKLLVSSDNGAANQLGGMLSDVGALLGVGNKSAGNLEQLLGVLGSNKLKLNVINQFDLIKYYDIENFKQDKSLKYFGDDYFFEIDENGLVDISLVNKSPERSVEILNYIIQLSDSLNRDISTEKAKNYRMFIEKRYNKALQDLSKAENEFREFQQKTNLYVLPDQIMLTLNSIVTLEAEVYTKEIKLEVLETIKPQDDPNLKAMRKEVEIFKSRLNNIKNGKDLPKNSIAFVPLQNLPEIYEDYVNVYREFEIQNRIMETLTPLYEQALMDEEKSIPTVIVLDPPIIPELKHFPKKASIIIIVTILAFFVHFFFVVRGDKALESDPRNLFEEKESKFYNRIYRLYSLKHRS